jgi:hemoglobin-like flavoprotein
MDGGSTNGRELMNSHRKRLVQESWEAIARDHERIAVAFYERLFEIDSSAPGLFAKTDMVAQRGKFLMMLGDIVRNLDLPEELIPTVSSLGRRHRDYGVRDIDYDRVREALFGAIAAEVGDAFTEELRDAWEEAYALTASVMKRGAHTAT